MIINILLCFCQEFHMDGCVHHIPGRARFKLTQLKEDISLLADIEGHFMTLKGIKRIQANVKAGSLVIFYDEKQMSLNVIEEKLISAGFLYRYGLVKTERKQTKSLPPLVSHVSGAFGRAVVHALLERAITKGVGSFLAR
ncbi:HMA2 domain-containing protein [Terasakiella sp.]|uniref:HMA2 domain-containing protein n=1 Tax=Terasakiella sp. TaxID=2034861 RepID=UPI003AA8A295